MCSDQIDGRDAYRGIIFMIGKLQRSLPLNSSGEEVAEQQ